MTRTADGALQLRRPNGWVLTAVPPPVMVPIDPVEELRTWHAARGIHVDARTGCPTWLGERLDVGWAIGVLHPLAAGREHPTAATA